MPFTEESQERCLPHTRLAANENDAPLGKAAHGRQVLLERGELASPLEKVPRTARGLDGSGHRCLYLLNDVQWCIGLWRHSTRGAIADIDADAATTL